MATDGKTYLFSIDLEDVRLWMPDGRQYRERVPANTHRYLAWLRTHNAKTTFFTVGQVAELYPSLIQEIAAEGHEIALHTHTHRPLPELGPGGLAQDVGRNIEALLRAGARQIEGFRAPIFSLTADTPWAHGVLAAAGLRYSSSVLPARNPLFGWPGFGTKPRQIDGIWEIPMSTARVGLGHLPFAGGTYMRLLPGAYVRHLFKQAQGPVLGYLHPYDIDTEQERFMHPGLGGSRLMNTLMYVGRQSLLAKLDGLLAAGARLQRYTDFVDGLAQDAQPRPAMAGR